VPEIARYILKRSKTYTFSALTASVDGKVHFESLGTDDTERSVERLRIPMNAKFVINDGQHRRFAQVQVTFTAPEGVDPNPGRELTDQFKELGWTWRGKEPTKPWVYRMAQ
jgi:DGQHR domain-containing protein